MDEITEEGLRLKHYGTRDWAEATNLKDKTETVPAEWYYDFTKFPYYAPGSYDPPLPTPDEIADAPQPCDRNSPLAFNYLRLVHGKYVVKFSRTVSVFHEAENLLFLEQNPVLHFPKLYAAFSHQGADPLKRGYHANGQQPPRMFYIIMEYIEGDTFMEAWPRMTASEREVIGNQIGHQLCQLRNVPQPKESPTQEIYYGRVGYQRLESISGMFGDPRRPLCGPFNSYEEVVEEMASTAEKEACTIYVGGYGDGWDKEPGEKVKQFRPTLLAAKPEDRRPVFTHLDLKLSNMVLRPRHRSVSTKETEPYGTDYDVVFIDWELSAWLPAFTELWAAQLASGDDLNEIDGDFFLDSVYKTIGPHNLDIPRFLWSCINEFWYRYF